MKLEMQSSLVPAVVYLARMHEGNSSFSRFVESYKKFDAGTTHRLIVIFKGFSSDEQLDLAKSVFEGIKYEAYSVDDSGYDIGAYAKIVEASSYSHYCFLNTHTEIKVYGWLDILFSAMCKERVGLVGSSGSYESLRNSVGLINHVRNGCRNLTIPYDPKIDFYFSFVIGQSCMKWRVGHAGALQKWIKRRQASVRNWVREFRGKSNPLVDAQKFPPFPNPHIRSNGFLVHRDWMKLAVPKSIQTKLDACLFESGPQSLTSKIRDAGLEVVLVDKHGHHVGIRDWWRTNTFRLGSQEDLLFHDNQVRSFFELDDGSKYTHKRMTWGDYLGPAQSDFPSFGFTFGTKDHR